MMRSALLLILLASSAASASASAADVTFAKIPDTVNVFDTVEFTATQPPSTGNPFDGTPFQVTITGPDGKTVTAVGFCDSTDGSVFKARYLPTAAGKHTAALAFDSVKREVSFTAVDGKRRGPIRVDPDHPHHFRWQGTGEHVFLNGMTTYWLLGVQDDARIRAAVDRLAANKFNRIRVALNARTVDGSRWFEPQVKSTEQFKFRVDPWPSGDPTSATEPKLDTRRFNLAVWQKLDRLIAHARSQDVLVSVIFHLDGADKGVDPFGLGDKKYAGSELEWNYYRYAAARLSASSNVMWDITNEWHLFRNVPWTNKAGEVLRSSDPNKLLMSVHGRGDFPFYKQPWADFALYQIWDEAGGYKFLRKARDLAIKAGKPMPHINEEYGYEDHYPGPWGGGRKKPARAADNRRKLAWEMSMAGGYQTTGERADEPGQGGWITGLGNDAMTLPSLHAKMVTFFTSFDWWRCDPLDGVADNGAMVLGEAGKQYAVYLPKGGTSTVKLPAGMWNAKWYNPRTGEWKPPVPATGEWKATAPDADDWAVLLRP